MALLFILFKEVELFERERHQCSIVQESSGAQLEPVADHDHHEPFADDRAVLHC
jgi:hypothetical protein